MKSLYTIALAWLLALGMPAAHAAGGGYKLDSFPESKLTDQSALQNGAKLFVNYCLNCHGASAMRYNRLRDIGLSDDQIRKNLMFTADKVGDPMRTALNPGDAKEWFGALPPDLSIVQRARASGDGSGADWLYTYLRAYYRDATRPTGWNNAVFENVGMPHALWQLQGARGATIEEVRTVKDDKGAGGVKLTITYDTLGWRTEKTEDVAAGSRAHEGRTVTLGKAEGGDLTQAQYDDAVADIVAYLTYMSDPSAGDRTRLGVWVLLFLALFTVVAWWLNREYWKDIK